MPEMLMLAPGITVAKPDDGAELRYNQAAVDRVEQFFSLAGLRAERLGRKASSCCRGSRQFIREFFGVQVRNDRGQWVRYRRFGYDEIPKKNGKTEFNAGLGLYFLLGDGESKPHVAIFAVDKINADILYQAAKFMVENTAIGQPTHRPLAWCRDSVREIRTRFGGIMKVYSSDAEGKHGFSFSAILCDEIHAWKGQAGHRLWTVLTQGTDAARLQQAVLVMTTAGDDPDRTSIGWQLHELCRRLLAWRRDGAGAPAGRGRSQMAAIMYGISTLTQDDPDKIAELDIYDEALWKTCNPSYGVTLMPRQFRDDARAAKMSEAAERNFRWLRLNQWISTKDVGWMPLTLYDKTQIGPLRQGGTGGVGHGEPDRQDLLCRAGYVPADRLERAGAGISAPAGLEQGVALFQAWRPLEGVLEAEKRDHVPYRDWEPRAGFLTCVRGT